MNEIDAIIADRAKTHGEYAESARTAQAIKRAMRVARHWESIPPTKQHSLELIATKIARIVHGDPILRDNWIDIAGYAILAAKEIEQEMPCPAANEKRNESIDHGSLEAEDAR